MAEVSSTPAPAITATEVLDGSPDTALPTVPQGTEPIVEPEEKLSPKFQALIRRERIAIERERAAKVREDEINTRVKSFEEREAKLAKFEAIRKERPLEALDLLGMTYQDLTQVALADGNIPAEMQAKRTEEKFEAFLREQREKEQRQLQDQQTRAEAEEKEADDQFKGEISTYIKENADRYELIRFEDVEDLVYTIIDTHYERTKDPETGIGKVMTIAEAADKVEQHLEKKYDSSRSLKKVQTLLAPRPEPTVNKPEANRSRETKTLTNQLSATQMPPQTRPLTDEERVQRAVAYARSLRK